MLIYSKFATTVIRAYSVPDWFEALDRLIAVGQLAMGAMADAPFRVWQAAILDQELADQAERLHPGLKILFTTGYTRNAIVHHGRLDPGVNLIGKPYSFDQLAVKIRSVLDER